MTGLPNQDPFVQKSVQSNVMECREFPKKEVSFQ